MEKLTVVKFGGSAIGVDGEGLPTILDRINHLKTDSKVIVVCSAPLTEIEAKKHSLTDVMLNLGNNMAAGDNPNVDTIANSYAKIIQMISDGLKEECQKKIDEMLSLAIKSLQEANEQGKFEDEVRAKALAYSGEVLMSHVMNFLLKSNGIKSESVSLDDWPICLLYTSPSPRD